ncbi:hypothetical protein TOPH_05342 [Tolypocladium ophioglossoides CBS 100239]|uniref:Uncharacterized protein n=1 Tax=Tolypocladium ophioglossoides (strain CBS 100239) TaxID=1163406 RepID=A0A0L0N7I1_TOLOC|nr:hypothetical protein TOPH_05342 [Tolypocladium ophioglossoides CBS 100239]
MAAHGYNNEPQRRTSAPHGQRLLPPDGHLDGPVVRDVVPRAPRHGRHVHVGVGPGARRVLERRQQRLAVPAAAHAVLPPEVHLEQALRGVEARAEALLDDGVVVVDEVADEGAHGARVGGRAALVRVPHEVDVERRHDGGVGAQAQQLEEARVAVDGAPQRALERRAADPHVRVHLVDEVGLARDGIAQRRRERPVDAAEERRVGVRGHGAGRRRGEDGLRAGLAGEAERVEPRRRRLRRAVLLRPRRELAQQVGGHAHDGLEVRLGGAPRRKRPLAAVDGDVDRLPGHGDGVQQLVLARLAEEARVQHEGVPHHDHVQRRQAGQRAAVAAVRRGRHVALAQPQGAAPSEEAHRRELDELGPLLLAAVPERVVAQHLAVAVAADLDLALRRDAHGRVDVLGDEDALPQHVEDLEQLQVRRAGRHGGQPAGVIGAARVAVEGEDGWRGDHGLLFAGPGGAVGGAGLGEGADGGLAVLVQGRRAGSRRVEDHGGAREAIQTEVAGLNLDVCRLGPRDGAREPRAYMMNLRRRSRIWPWAMPTASWEPSSGARPELRGASDSPAIRAESIARPRA